MMCTNQQEVIAAKKNIENLKSEYMKSLNELIEFSGPSDQDKIKIILDCQKKGTALFNYIENFVGDSDLLGAHASELWVTGFAEDCLSHLGSLIMHFKFLREKAQAHPGMLECVDPDVTAYANMQRMVARYLPKEETEKLRQNFSDNNLPTVGFSVREMHSSSSNWQIIISIILGILFIIGSIAIVIFIPNPTGMQQLVFRAVLALGLALIAPIIPGFLSLTAKLGGEGNQIKIFTGGAVAIFILIWLVNPPKF